MPADGTIPTTIQHLALDLLDPSPTQPRKTFDETKLKELAGEITAHGVLQPITVRTRGKRYEIVIGERRVRASKIAGKATVPALVRELDDATVIEVQLVENAQREDVHPLEEAEAFEALHVKHKRTVDEIAAKVGKSKAHVYARLKLCALVPEARKAYLEGQLSASTALYVARIPPPLQKDAVKDLEVPKWQRERDGIEQLSARAAFEIIDEKYMLRLSEAPFDRGDAELVKKAGPCTTCPKRTGNQKELFADVRSADVCTDRTCFAAKKTAAWEQKKKKAEAAGQTVLDGAAAKKVAPYGTVEIRSGYVDLDQKQWNDPKQRTLRELAKAKKVELPAPVLVRTDDGTVREVVSAKVAAPVLKQPRVANDGKGTAEDRAKAKLEDEIEKRATVACIEAIVAKAESPKAQIGVLRAAVEELSEMAGVDDLLDRRKLPLHQFDKLVEKAKAPQLFGILAELLATAGNVYPPSRSATELCDALGIDHKTLRAKAAAAVKAEQKAKLAGAPDKGMPAKDAKAVKLAAKKAPKKKGGGK